MLLLALLFGFFVASKAWILDVNYRFVEVGKTRNVNLYCRYDEVVDQNTAEMETIFRIRIYWLDAQRIHRTLEKIGLSDRPSSSNTKEVTSNFDAENFKESFLNVTWPIATEETPGEYGCEVLGYSKRNEPLTAESPLVTIEHQDSTLPDLLKVIEELNSEFQESENALQEKIRYLENQLAEAQQTVIKLSKESLDADSVIRKELYAIQRKYQESDKQLRKEIAESKDSNAKELHRQASTIANFQQDIFELKNETKELNANLANDVLDIREEMSKRIMQLNDTYTTKYEYDILKLKKETESAIERLKLETNKQINENFTNLQQELVDLKTITNEIGEKIQKEKLDRRTEDTILDVKFKKELENLNNSITLEILDQFLKLDMKLNQSIYNSTLLNLQRYMKLEDGMSDVRNQIHEGEDIFEQKISDLRNFVRDLISNRSKDFRIDLHERLSSVENYTNHKINIIEDKLKENSDEIRNSIRIEMEKKIREFNEDLQNDLSSLRNFTSAQTDKQKEVGITIQHLKHLVENNSVTEVKFKEHLSAVYNQTTAGINRNGEAVLELRNSTVEIFNVFDDMLNKRIDELNDVVDKISNECVTKTEELSLNSTRLNNQLVTRIKSIDNYNIQRKNDVHNSFQEIVHLIDSVNTKYENVTSNLREDLDKKSQCMCPTAQPSRPIADYNTTAASGMESTSSKITQPSIAITNAPKVTSAMTTGTTMSHIHEWPEGSYALITPKTGCPDSDGITWEGGWIQYHTATDFNEDLVSKGNHFKTPIFRQDGVDNFVQVHYCVKKQNAAYARPWPKGSYCINRLSGQCPSGFKSGYIQYTEEKTHIQRKHQNAPDMSYEPVELKRLFYCCRRDGSTDEAINMPTEKPFYLYRVNNEACQKVSGMRSSMETLQIDTGHEDNEDAFENIDLHPHASLYPVRHVLCYYVPATTDTQNHL